MSKDTKTTRDYSRSRVTVVSKKGETALVQYEVDGSATRKYIPVDEIGEGLVLDTVLARGIPYGYPWDEMEMTFDGQKFSNELHQLGIWTVEDALKYPQKLWSALNATYADNISKVLKLALHEKRSNHNGR